MSALRRQCRDAPAQGRFGIALTLAAFLPGIAETTRGAGEYLKIDYPASSASNELQVAVTYTLWMPEGVKKFRE
jgi:hypothetical protein